MPRKEMKLFLHYLCRTEGNENESDAQIMMPKVYNQDAQFLIKKCLECDEKTFMNELSSNKFFELESNLEFWDSSMKRKEHIN